MSTISTQNEGGLLIVNVVGDLHAAEAVATINRHYTNGVVKDVIWDFTHGLLLNTSDSEFRTIAAAVKKTVDDGYRQGAKTVFVGNATVEYGILRMYTAIAETSGVHIRYNVFRTVEEAKEWIAGS